MLTVRNRGGLSFNPCPGLNLITVTVTLNPAQDYCGEGSPSVIDVWVNSSTPSITQSYQAGNPIYMGSDCTTCAQTGWYRDAGWMTPSSGPQPTSINDYYYFKGCTWNDIGNCSNRQQIQVRANSSRDPLCDNVGTLTNVYLDNEFTANEGFTTNNIYTTHGIYGSATTNDPPLGINSGYLRTTDLALEEANGVWTRFWTNQFGEVGGSFGGPQQCTLEVNDPDPPTYYSFNVRKSTSWTPADVCDAPIVTYYLLEGTVFGDGTRLFRNNTGANAPDGYYKNSGTGLQPVPVDGEDTSNSVYQISGGDGILTLTAATCGRGGRDNPDFD